MNFSNFLLQAGYIQGPGAVWGRPGYAGIAYSDGDEIETRIAAIIAEAADISVFSRELVDGCTDWPSVYHLSSSRVNILRPCRGLIEGADVLEIGAGCGAITRYLGECGAQVLALEGSPRRAAIARSRIRDLANVTVLADRFDQFSCNHRFEVVTLIGVLEYAAVFSGGDDPMATMLERVRGFLKPDGKLIIAIENQLGMKYFAGAAEDHLGIPMYGIEGRYRAKEPQTFGRRQLGKILDRAGFGNQAFMAPFPDYKLPVSIVTEQGLSCEGFDAGAFAWQSARRDLQLPSNPVFAPELAWPVVAANGLTLDLANSFLIVAATEGDRLVDPAILAYHYSTWGRLACYCKETIFATNDDGGIEIRYFPLGQGAGINAEGSLLSFNLPATAKYVAGRSLSLDLLEIVTRDGWRIEEVGEFLRRYLRIVESFVASATAPLTIESAETVLPGNCFDLVPQNIFITPENEWRVIDQEWVLKDTIPAGWLLFRSLLQLVNSVTGLVHSASDFSATRMGLIQAALKAAGFEVSPERIEEYSAREAQALAAVIGETTSPLFHFQWKPYVPLNRHVTCPVTGDKEQGQVVRLYRQLLDQAEQISDLQRVAKGHVREIKGSRLQGGGQSNAIVRLGRTLDRFRPGQWKEYRKFRKALQEQPLLDPAWYLNQYPDVSKSKLDPVRHYVLFGVEEGRNPNPYFDTRWYLEEYPDVVGSGCNPLLHFLRHGANVGRNPNPYFDTSWYLREYPEVAASGLNPLLHYINCGVAEGKNPHPLFDTRWYLDSYPEVAQQGMEPLLHYLVHGWREGKNPNPYFNTGWYLSEYPEVAASGRNPLLHYIQHGVEDGTNPNPFFHTRWYLEQYPQVAGSGLHPLLHFLQSGKRDETNPCPYFDTQWYIHTYPDVGKSGLEPLAHFILHGAGEKRSPGPHFDSGWYAQQYPDVAASGLDPLRHFLRQGAREGRNPSPDFDAQWYLQEYPDVLESGMHPLLHFLQVGMKEGRRPHPDFDSHTYLDDYCRWLHKFYLLDDRDRKLIAGHIEDFKSTPVISVLMPVFDPPPRYLDEAIRSVRNQLYPYWELCFADDASTDPEVERVLRQHMAADARIKGVFRSHNGHISQASNSALELVTGEFVALLDHDDLLAEDALFWMAEAIQCQPDVGLIYSDEDKIDDQGYRKDPYFKSDWDPFLFLGHNMISHLGVYRTALVRDSDGFREGYEGSQDYDLAARIIERLKSDQIVHIPRVLYHWRILPGSTAVAIGEKPYAQVASEKAINEHLQRMHIPGRVELNRALGGMHRVIVNLPESPPLVSIIIVAHNSQNSVRRCIESILTTTTYPDYEIILVGNGYDDPSAYLSANLLKTDKIRLLRDSGPYDFTRLTIKAASEARGEVLVLLNNDIEVLTPEWLSEMVSLAILPGIGAVGAKLLYPDRTVKHGGCIMGLGGCVGHAHNGIPREAGGYLGRAQLLQMVTAVSAACLAVRKTVFDEVGGLDEGVLLAGCNDIDFCLKLRQHGYRNVWTPKAELIDHEAVATENTEIPAKQRHSWKEISVLKKRWPHSFFHDPAYNPNLSLEKPSFTLAKHPRLALGARCQSATFSKSLVAPPTGQPNLLLVDTQSSGTNQERSLIFAESLLRQGIIDSYAMADGKRFVYVSPGATGWFDAICLQGEPSGVEWFQRYVMGCQPYLIDWDVHSCQDSLDHGGTTDVMMRAVVHAGAVSIASPHLVRWLERTTGLALESCAHVVPNGISFPSAPPRFETPRGILWRFDDIDELPDNISEILRAVDEFSQKYSLPVYCQGRFPGEILAKIKGQVSLRDSDAIDLSALLRSRGLLLGIAPMKTDQYGTSALAAFSDRRMVEFGGLGIAAVYSASQPYRESDIRTGRVVDNTYENWLAALEGLFRGDYMEEENNFQYIREKRSIDWIARECWWPALAPVIFKEPEPISAFWPLL